ncbi:hypothetical protein QLQ12_22355 [Actinoplanes sp. NEAU-A12]|uniref:Type II secretion system protein n=1 Tax=Actinoplanes sandaracinus TaxID=3045177 RepID=A0ABT6WNR7_9ACTN|nr:hypothetical protein [Actinoplanes sandaracinus]MDI6101362.1 hypothetical protein [Actinoplanes sandaracinus]
MTLMSFMTVVIVGATAEIYSGTKRIDNTAEVRDQVDNSFRRLDREMRYANWVSKPGYVPASGSWYVEFATPDGCRQLKLSKGVLTMASWKADSPRGAPMPLAAGIEVISGGPDPIVRYRPGDQPYLSASPSSGMGANYQLVFQQVRLRFTIKAGSVTLPFDSVFTAQNTDKDTTETNPCDGGRV